MHMYYRLISKKWLKYERQTERGKRRKYIDPLAKHSVQGRSQEFATGTKEGSGDESPLTGFRGEAPRSRKPMLISSYDGGHAPTSPLVYATDSVTDADAVL